MTAVAGMDPKLCEISNTLDDGLLLEALVLEALEDQVQVLSPELVRKGTRFSPEDLSKKLWH